MLLRVFNKTGALAGHFTVTPGTTSLFIENAVWDGAGWSDDFVAAEVISVANGSVYAAPVKDPTVLDATSGTSLIANFNLGDLPLGPNSDPLPSF